MRKNYVVSSEYHGASIRRFLTQKEEYSSRSMRKITVKINGKTQEEFKTQLKKGDQVEVYEAEIKTNLQPKFMPLNIVYEDSELLIINKPPFLLVHPTKKRVDMTLAEAVLYYYQSKGESTVPRFYNRLDMNTSGLVILTKTAYAQSFLQKQEMEKYYLAIVEGVVQEDLFFIEKNIACKEGEIARYVSEQEGQPAKTKIVVKGREPNLGYSLVEAQLFTGRTHQIRVHLASVGHAIVGDELYGKASKVFKRQLLHSYKLRLTHPTLKTPLSIEIDLPEDMSFFSEW